MPVITRKAIQRQDLRANPARIYLFPDNAVRKGFYGYAKQMRGAKNALGVAIKLGPGRAAGALFSDAEYGHNVAIIENDFAPIMQALEEGKIVIIPEGGLLPDREHLQASAPRTIAFLEQKIESMMNYGKAMA